MSQLAIDIPTSGQEDKSIDIPLGGRPEVVDVPVADASVDIPVTPITGTIGPIKGFRNNLRLPFNSWQHFLHGTAKGAIEDNLIINLVRNITGNTTEQMLRDKHGDAEIDAMLAAQKERYESVSLADMKAAFSDDPGAFTAEFVNGIIADPELIITPIGWRTAATSVAARLKSVSTITKTATANIAGAGGAAGTAAALIAPISIAEQLDKTGEVNWGRVGEETLLASGLAVVLGSVGAKKFPVEKAVEIAESTAGAAQVMAVARTPLQEAISEALSTVKQSDLALLGKLAIDKTGAKSVSMLDDAAKISPSLRRIRQELEYYEFSDRARQPYPYFERIGDRTGEFTTRLQDIMDQTRTPFLGRITRAKNKEIVDGLRGIVRPNKQARAVRELLDDIRQYALDAGVPEKQVGYLKNYFPRVYNARLLRKNEDAFIKALTDNGIDAGIADDILHNILDNDGVYLGSKKVPRMDHGGRVAKSGALEKGRPLKDVPDEALAPFLENEAYPVIRKYVLNTVKRAEFARSFGASGQKLNKALKSAMDELHAAGRGIKRHELKRVYDLVDAVQGMYRPFESRAWANASKVAGTYQILRTLPLATLSSITEPLVILARGQLRSTLQAMPKLISHTAASWARILYKNFPKPEATRAVERMGLALDDSVGEVLTQTFGGQSNRVTHAFFKTTLLSQWTRMNRILGFHSGRYMIIDNLKDIGKGKKWRLEEKHLELTELNIPVKEGVAWINRGMPDDEFAHIVDMGAARFTNEVVMSPRVTNRPLWHSNPNAHLLAQLKGFPTTFGNTVMKRWFNLILRDPIYQGPKIAATGTAMTMLAMLVNDLRDEVQGRERKEEPYQKVVRALERWGMFGIGQAAIDALYAHRYGRSGLAQILGPAASQIDALLDATGKSIEAQDIDQLRSEVVKGIPGVSQKKEWRDEIEELLGEDN